jgi:hypothetical protein
MGKVNRIVDAASWLLCVIRSAAAKNLLRINGASSFAAQYKTKSLGVRLLNYQIKHFLFSVQKFIC